MTVALVGRFACLALLALQVAAGCNFKPAAREGSGSGGIDGGGTGGSGATGGTRATGGSPDGGGGTGPTQCNPCTYFPPTPILDMPAGGSSPPADVSTTFGPAGSGSPSGGPCILDPEPD